MTPLRQRLLAALTAFFLASCATAPNAARVGALHDLVGDYLLFTVRARHASDEAAARRFRRDVVSRHPAVYSSRVFGFDPQLPAQLDPRFIAARPSLLRHDAEIRAAARAVGEAWPRIEATFDAAFADAGQHHDAYMLVSLGTFDGATREVDGRPAVLFGVDTIAADSVDAVAIDALGIHELFHLYHARWLPEGRTAAREPLWMTLWREGLATTVAHRLVAAATPRVLFGGDAATPAALAVEMPRLAERFRDSIDASDEAAFTDWFLLGGKTAQVPPRAGYALGYAVVERLAGDRSLDELARLRGPELRRQILIALGRIAGGY